MRESMSNQLVVALLAWTPIVLIAGASLPEPWHGRARFLGSRLAGGTEAIGQWVRLALSTLPDAAPVEFLVGLPAPVLGVPMAVLVAVSVGWAAVRWRAQRQRSRMQSS